MCVLLYNREKRLKVSPLVYGIWECGQTSPGEKHHRLQSDDRLGMVWAHLLISLGLYWEWIVLIKHPILNLLHHMLINQM